MYIDTQTRRAVRLHDIRQANPSVSLPRSPTDEHLAPLGYAVLHSTQRPSGEVVTQKQPEQGEDGKWYQAWEVRDFTPEELSQQLADAKKEKRQEINRARDAAFEAGLPYDIAGEPDVVQTRVQDKINLLGLRIEAREQKAAGVTQAAMPFRGLNNIERMLTPEQMIDLTNAALGHIQAIYQHSWQRKDAASAAASLEEVAAVDW